MVEHLVLVKLRPAAAAAEVDAVLEGLRGLPAVVPGIVDLACGRNFSPERAQGFEFGLRVRFPGRAELAAYAVHPEHQRVSRALLELAADLVVVDFEV